MARAVGYAPSTIHGFGKPSACSRIAQRRSSCHRTRCLWKKVRDIVGLYLSPPERALVLCVDEKSQIQALDRSRPLLPMRPGQVERRTHDYVRHGTTTLLWTPATVLSAPPCTGVRTLGSPTTSIHLVMDNYATHKTPAVQRWLAGIPAGMSTSRRPAPPG